MIHIKLMELFPRSAGLQRYMCECLIVIIRFCQNIVISLKKSQFKQLAATFGPSFDQYFKDFGIQMERWVALMKYCIYMPMRMFKVDASQSQY